MQIIAEVQKHVAIVVENEPAGGWPLLVSIGRTCDGRPPRKPAERGDNASAGSDPEKGTTSQLIEHRALLGNEVVCGPTRIAVPRREQQCSGDLSCHAVPDIVVQKTPVVDWGMHRPIATHHLTGLAPRRAS
jgi:hypothetical protein